MGFEKYIFILLMILGAHIAFGQEEQVSTLERLNSHITRVSYKKGKNTQIPFGRVEFTDVDVKIGGLPLELNNSQFRDGEASFNTNVYLQEEGFIFEGVNRVFVLSPEIPQDSFVRTIKEAEIRELNTVINQARFKVKGDLFSIKSNDIDFTMDNFDIFCNKNMMAHENDLDSVINSCWTDGKVRAQRGDDKPEIMKIGISYIMEKNQLFKLYSEIKNIVLDARDRIVSYSANVLETSIDNFFDISSGPIEFNCKHSRKREFNPENIQKYCLNEFSFTQNETKVTYFYTPEATDEDPNPEQTHMKINLENSKVETTRDQIIADIDALNIDQKDGMSFGLFNLDIKCPKTPKFSDFNNTDIINACLSNAKVVKRKDNKPSQAKIEYKESNEDTLINVIMNVNEVESNHAIGKFDLDLFKVWYADKSSEYEILFPKTKVYCGRKAQTSQEDIHLLNDCLTNNSLSTGSALIDELHGGMKFYISPIDLNTTKEGMRVDIRGMQFMDKDFHANIMGNSFKCDTFGGKTGQSVEEIMKGCLKKGQFNIDKIASIDHKKKDTRTHGEYRSRYDKGQDPFAKEDLKLWDIKDLNINFEDKKFKLKTWVKAPLFLGLPSQEFVVEAKGNADYEIEKNGKEWLILKMDKASIQKLFVWVNGDNRTGLILMALRKLMPEERIVVGKACKEKGKKNDPNCNEVKILMN